MIITCEVSDQSICDGYQSSAGRQCIREEPNISSKEDIPYNHNISQYVRV